MALHSRKNGAEDLKKAKWYLERLIKLREKEEAMGKAIEEITKEVLSVNYDPDDYSTAKWLPGWFLSIAQRASRAL
jgi:predicted ribosome quality control (RQC) complex YloA/Tae2 family protein